MLDTTLSDQQLIDTFLPHILENEAKGVLQDLLAQPTLAMQFLFRRSNPKGHQACSGNF